MACYVTKNMKNKLSTLYSYKQLSNNKSKDFQNYIVFSVNYFLSFYVQINLKLKCFLFLNKNFVITK